MIDDNLKREKDYLIGSLEKKTADFEIYYQKDKFKEKKFEIETTTILKDLRKHELDDSDRSIIQKTVEILKKIKRRLQ